MHIIVEQTFGGALMQAGVVSSADVCGLNEDGRFSLICRARIDNKNELCKRLDIPVFTNISEEELILRSFLKWGKDCAQYIIGDWAFALWDQQTRELFIARDHFGLGNVYYYHGKDFFIFSWQIDQILSYPGIKKELNTNAMVQLSSFHKRDAQTFYKGIFQVPCGHTLTLKDNRIYLNNYWLPNSYKPIRYACSDDYVTHFKELYEEAVACRVNVNVKTGISLSSGLDSGSVAVLAASQFKKSGRILEAFTWRPSVVSKEAMALNTHVDEVPLVKTLLADVPSVKLNIVDGAYGNFINVIRRTLNIHQQPVTPFVHYFDVFEAAQKHRIELLLTGDWGNHTISYGGDSTLYFKEMQAKSTRLYLRELWSWKRNYNKSWPQSINDGVISLLLGDKIHLKKNKDLTRSYLNPVAINEALKSYQGITPNLERYRKTSRYPLNNLFNMFQSGVMGQLATFGQGFGITVSVPVIDKRLVEFCLGIPQSQYINTQTNRLLIKRAMEGHIPSSVLHHKRRGLQGADLPLKCIAEAREILELLQQFKRSAIVSYWLDLETLEMYLKEIVGSVNIPVKQMFHKIAAIQKGLILGLFLMRFE